MRIDSIQVLRAFAALSVVMQHVLHDTMPLDPGGTIAAWHGTLPWGDGVDLFFVISGFIMVHASAGLFGQPGAARVFLGRRLARIVPLYWAATAAFVVLAVGAGGTLNSVIAGPWEVAASLAFIPWTRLEGAVQPVLSLGWTLNYEVMFYAVFALFIRLPRGMALACVTAALLGMVALHPAAAGQPQAQFWTDPVILEFAFGMAVAVLRGHGIMLAMPWRATMAGLAVGVALVLHRASPDMAEPLRAGLPMALLLAAAALGPDPAWSGRLWVWLIWLGEASYALYLVHPFPMRALSLVWRAGGLTGLPAAVACGGASVAASVVAAGLCQRWIERPLTRRLRPARLVGLS